MTSASGMPVSHGKTRNRRKNCGNPPRVRVRHVRTVSSGRPECLRSDRASGVPSRDGRRLSCREHCPVYGMEKIKRFSDNMMRTGVVRFPGSMTEMHAVRLSLWRKHGKNQVQSEKTFFLLTGFFMNDMKPYFCGNRFSPGF